MNLPGLASPDDLITRFLQFALGPGLILSLLLLIWSLYSWYQFLRSTLEKGRTAVSIAGGAVAKARNVTPLVAALAIVSSVTLVIAQTIWLAFNYVLGNILSGALGVNRPLHRIFSGNIVPPWGDFTATLHLDSVSAACVIISAVALVRVYVLAMRDRNAGALGVVFGLPGYFFAVCGLIGGALTVLDNAIGSSIPEPRYGFARWVVLMFGTGITGLLYALACLYVMRAPLMVREMWSRLPSKRPVSRYSSPT